MAILPAFLALLLGASLALADDWQALGEPVSPAEIAAQYFVVMPNGEGLPSGGGSALEGEAL